MASPEIILGAALFGLVEGTKGPRRQIGPSQAEFDDAMERINTVRSHRPIREANRKARMMAKRGQIYP